MKKIFTVIALLAAVCSITGCGNTLDGAEKDIGKAADAVKDATN